MAKGGRAFYRLAYHRPFRQNHVLFVRVDSDALRNELSYSKSLLLKNLNEIVGKELLSEIVLN